MNEQDQKTGKVICKCPKCGIHSHVSESNDDKYVCGNCFRISTIDEAAELAKKDIW